MALPQPYFHTGKVWKLKEVVAIMGSAQLGIRLSDDETETITLFLKTLSGR
jgi:cytochrome c peroxidase